MQSNLLLKWEIITDIKKVPALFNKWTSLNNSLQNSNLFNSPTWLVSWLDNYWQHNWHLRILTAWHNEELMAIAPLYYQQESFLSFKTLYPLGQGEAEVKEVSTEYLDILINNNTPKNTMAEIKSKIEQWIQDLNTDQFIWRALLSKSNAREIMTHINTPSHISPATRYRVDCPSLTPEKLSKNMRSRYRRGLNQLNKLEAKIDWVQIDDHKKYWQTMKEFHQNRWQNKDKRGAFCSDEFNQFHKDFRKASPKSIAMSAIWVNDVPIALHYYFVDATTLYFYQSGWDESQYSNVSPGLILHLWTIENNNKPYYDFMMGKTQGSYKAKFGTQQQPMTNITITFSPIKVMMYRALNKIKLILIKTN